MYRLVLLLIWCLPIVLLLAYHFRPKRRDLYGFWLAIVLAFAVATSAEAACRGGCCGGHCSGGGCSGGSCSSCSGGNCGGGNCGGFSSCSSCGRFGCGSCSQGSRFGSRSHGFCPFCLHRQPTQVLPRNHSLLRRSSADDRDDYHSAAPSREHAPLAPRDVTKCDCCAGLCKNCTGKPGCKCGCPDCTCNQKTSHKSVENDLSDTETRLVAGINAFRAQQNLPPLAVDNTLERVARERAAGMTSPHNCPPYGYADRHVAHYASWPAVNEDVSGTHWSDGSLATPESSVRSWKESDGHRRCLLGQANVNGRWINERFNCIGVARGRRYDVAVLGRNDDSRRVSSANPTPRYCPELFDRWAKWVDGEDSWFLLLFTRRA